MDWFYAENKTPIGPISEETFFELVREGKIEAKTLVWHMGMEDWQPYASLMEKAAPPAVNTAEPETEPMDRDTGQKPTENPQAEPSALVCSECALPMKRNDGGMFHGEWVCNVCRPGLEKKRKAELNAAGVVSFAGCWPRFFAKMIDVIIIWILGLLFTVLAGNLLPAASDANPSSSHNMLVYFLLYFLISAAYTTFFLGRWGATPGKMNRGLRVVNASGKKIGYGRSFIRFLGELFSMLLLGAGYSVAALDRQKRSLHDRIVDTRVVA